jgi:hypothetical protein
MAFKTMTAAVGQDFIFILFFVDSYAESRLPQGNLNKPDVVFCFMSAAIS